MLLSFAVASLVEIVSAAACPTARAVEVELRALLPAGLPPGDRAEVRETGGGLTVALAAADGTRLGERTLPVGPSCSERAQAVAVVIAAWEAELRPAPLRRAPPRVTRAPSPPPAKLPAVDARTYAVVAAHTAVVDEPPAQVAPVTATPAPTPTPTAAATPMPAATPIAAAAAPVARPASPAATGGSVVASIRPRRPLRYEVSASFLGSLAGADFAPGATAELLLAPGRTRFAARLALLGTAMRNQPLADGRVTWTRISLALGPAWRWCRGRFVLDLHAEALAALLVVEGVGYSTTRQSFDFDPGLGAGARVAVRLGRFTPHLGVAVGGWLRQQQVRVTGTDSVVGLPRFEVFLSAGVGLGNFL